MIPNELAERVRAEVKGLKEAQDQFLRTYKEVVVHRGGPEWRKMERETLLHQVRQDIIPIMEREGMNARDVQALCAWAERQLTSQ
jgi:hypothetical protein